MAREDYLFNSTPASNLSDHQRSQMLREIEGMDSDRLLNTNTEDFIKYLLEKYRIDIPILNEAAAEADQKEVRRDISGDPRRMGHYLDRGPVIATGTEVVIDVPFSGDAAMFSIQPQTFYSVPPLGEISNQAIKFRCWGTNMQPESVRAQFDQWLIEIKQYLTWLEESFRGFNDNLVHSARSTIQRRREKLLADRNLVGGLGIPLKRRTDSGMTYGAPEIRRLAPKMPIATAGTYKPEPVLEEVEYQHILSIIESMVHVMERSPKAFHSLDEESLRSHFLVQLNGHYEGQATGETFNYQGKTDILIRSGDRNIFIAECKFWGGAAKLTETVDQLLGYLSWRDSKAAILLFNRNKNFSKVLEAIPVTTSQHPSCQRAEGTPTTTKFRYAFRHKDDPAKILHLTIIAFHIPSER